MAHATTMASTDGIGSDEGQSLNRSDESTDDCFFPAWAELTRRCAAYCAQSGYRFQPADFEPEAIGKAVPAEAAARRHALPAVHAYKERCLRLAQSSDEKQDASASAYAADQALVTEFRTAQRLLADDATHQIMSKSCEVLGLLGSDTVEGDDGVDTAYHDVSAPLPLIAARLGRYDAQLDEGGVRELRYRRLLHATFIIDFGESYGQPRELDDETSAELLRVFWVRVREWGGRDAETRDVVAALTGGSGGMIVGGAAGRAAAAAHASPSRRHPRRVAAAAALHVGAQNLNPGVRSGVQGVRSGVNAFDEEMDSLFNDGATAARAAWRKVSGGASRARAAVKARIQRRRSGGGGGDDAPTEGALMRPSTSESCSN